jgi:hypothetical protein
MLNYLERLGARLAHGLQQPINTSATIIMALFTFLWGCWLLSPFWRVFNQADLYHNLRDVAPEEFWGAFAVFVGGVMIWGIIRHTRRALEIGAFAGWCHWLIISTGYFLGDWRNTGGLTAFMIAVYCGYIYLNLRVNRDNLHFEKEKGTL